MITFRSVTKFFGDGPPALENISFHAEPGEFLFLTGPSGSGKTTLLKLLTKEYIPTEGEIEFQGKPLSKMRNSQLHLHRRSIGVVFQDYRLLPDLNVWENIALALQIIGKKQAEIEERVTDLLELVQLTDKAYYFPNQLSGGESQRIGIARALATAPAVLLADEPTGNLDPQNTLMIARLFDRINQLGTTILFATHDTNILGSLHHRRLTFEKGKLTSDSGPQGSKTSTHPAKAKEAAKKEMVKEPSATQIEKLASAEKPAPADKSVSLEKEVVSNKQPEKPKKSFLKLPKLSFGFKKKKPTETATAPKPLIQQENLSGSKVKSTKEENQEPKKHPQTLVEVESLQTSAPTEKKENV